VISGSLLDVSFPDLLQFLHLSGRSGTLYLERDAETAYISFHKGRIASAWCPTSITVVEHLLEAGRLRQDDVDKARAIYEREQAYRTLGEILISVSGVKRDDLRDAVARKIEQTVFELVAWRRGTFRFVVEEVRYDEEILFAPKDVAPQVDLDTQIVLMEALRLSDERIRDSRPITAEAKAAVAAVKRKASAHDEPIEELPKEEEAVTDERDLVDEVVDVDVGPGRIDLMMHEGTLLASVSAALLKARVGAPAPWRDGKDGTALAPASLIVCDLADPGVADRVARIHRERPDTAIVAVVGELESAAGAYLRGAVAVVPRDPIAIAACCENIVRARRVVDPAAAAEAAASADHLERLRGLVDEIRAGVVATNLPANLMSILAKSADRGVLFLARRNTLVVLTAFGRNHDRQTLAQATRGLRLLVETGGPLAHCLEARVPIPLLWERDDIPDGLRIVVGRPESGRAVLLPVLGAKRSIAVVYLDNGDRHEAIADMELLELATVQFGLAIENEILRRQIER